MSSYLIENKPNISLREFLQSSEVKPSREYFDANSDKLTYSLLTGPSGLTINLDSGLIT